MNEISYKQFLDNLNSGAISPYQVYDADIDYPQYFSKHHYLENPQDTIDINMPLNIGFLDIEVYTNNSGEFPQVKIAEYPINSITLRITSEKKYVSFFSLTSRNASRFPYSDLSSVITYFQDELRKNGYLDEDETIEIHLFNSELKLTTSFWNYIHSRDPAIISGWNSSEFDVPYMYQRLCNITNDEKGHEAAKIMSKFGVVKRMKMYNRMLINISDYTDMDLLYLYKPRDDGGLNYGKKRPSYALDWVADAELGLKKLEYKGSGMTLDTFYDKDPVNFLLYNIIDVVLIKKLNDKLKHIESHNMLRRLMKTTIGLAMRGPAMLFDTMTQYDLATQGKYTRFGLVQEKNQHITGPQLSRIPKPKDSSVKWTLDEVTEQKFRAITSRYPGAYVKDGLGKVISSPDEIVIDMDATALYPSMMLQHNISFDSIFGRIIDPICYQFLGILDQHIGKNSKVPGQVYAKLLEYAKKYTDKLSPQNKGEYVQYLYYILGHLINGLEKKNVKMSELMNPQIQEHYILLKLYLLPLIDLITEIHEKSEEYNTFCHDYLLNNKPNVTKIWLVENITEPTIKIVDVDVDQFHNYLVQNNISVNLAGTLLYTHDYKPGIFSKFLTNILAMRKQYKSTRDSYKEGSNDYKFYDMRQFATKIVANTTYG